MQDRRRSPRYSFTRPMVVSGRGGEVFEARSSDISATAIGLLMARSVVVALAQGGSILTTGDRFELAFAQGGTSDPADGLHLDCRVRHVRRLSREQYVVGAQFTDMTPGQEAALSMLLHEAAAVSGA